MKAPRTRGQADQAVRQAETRLYAKSCSGFESVFSVGNTQPEATIRRLRCGGEPGALRRVAARIDARLLGFRSVKGSPAFRKRGQRRASARTRVIATSPIGS